MVIDIKEIIAIIIMILCVIIGLFIKDETFELLLKIAQALLLVELTLATFIVIGGFSFKILLSLINYVFC